MGLTKAPQGLRNLAENELMGHVPVQLHSLGESLHDLLFHLIIDGFAWAHSPATQYLSQD